MSHLGWSAGKHRGDTKRILKTVSGPVTFLQPSYSSGCPRPTAKDVDHEHPVCARGWDPLSHPSSTASRTFPARLKFLFVAQLMPHSLRSREVEVSSGSGLARIRRVWRPSGPWQDLNIVLHGEAMAPEWTMVWVLSAQPIASVPSRPQFGVQFCDRV